MSYKNEINEISPDRELVFDTKRKMREISYKHAKPRRYLALAVALILLISTTVTTFASGDLVLSQVNKSCQFDGIEMNITDVNIKDNEDGDAGEIRFTLHDTTDKNRINDLTDIDSFDVRGFKTDGCVFESFDKETKTASYILKVKEWPNGGISYFNRHGRITVNAILTNRNSKTVKADINLADSESAEDETGSSTSIFLIGGEDNGSEVYNFNYLDKDVITEKFNDAEWLRVKNYGFTSKDHFNVRTNTIGDKSKYYKYELFLKDENGKVIYKNPYSERASIINSNEVIFEVDKKDIKNYTLCANIVEYKDEDIIEGTWETVFHK